MDKAQIQRSPSTNTGKQNTQGTKTRSPKNTSPLHSVPNSSPYQPHDAFNHLTPAHLIHLQRTLGNQAVGRIIQAKLTISHPDDPYEREADQVADKVMRMPDPVTSGEEETKVQTKPLSSQITPLVHRMPEKMADEEHPPVQAKQEEGAEHDEEAVVAKKPSIQSTAGEETPEDEQTVAPKLKPSADVPIQRQSDEEEKPLQAKFAMGSSPQQDQEEKKQEIDQSGSVVHRQTEEDEAVQTKALPRHSPQVSRITPINAGSAYRSIQRLCNGCAEEKQQEEGKPELAQRKPARYQLHDDHDEEEQKVQPKGEHKPTPQVSPSIAANIQTLNHGGSPLPKATRTFFEPRFGADFSGVRVHTGSQAAETAKSINARAFTVGNNIAFGGGQYAPESSEGRKLLAHELTHVIQQNKQSLLVRLQRDITNPAASSDAGQINAEALRAQALINKVKPLDESQEATLLKAVPGARIVSILKERDEAREHLQKEKDELLRLTPENGPTPLPETPEGQQLKRIEDRVKGLTEKVNHLEGMVKAGLEALGVISEDALVKYVNEDFPNLFFARAKQIAIAELDENERIVDKEAEKYGLNACVDPQQKQDLIKSAADLHERNQRIAKLQNQLASLQTAAARDKPIAGVPDPEKVSSTEHDITALTNRISEESVELDKRKNAAALRHPVLLQDDIDLSAIASGSDEAIQAQIGGKINKIKENINETKKNISQNVLKVWNLKDIVNITISELGVGENSVLLQVINNRIKQSESDKHAIDIALAAIGITAFIVAIVATGGAAAVAAGVAVGVGVGQASHSIQQYLATTAASNISLDPRITKLTTEEPELAWVILDIVGVVADVAEVISIFNRLRSAAKAMQTLGELQEFAKIARTVAPAASENLIKSARRELLRGKLKDLTTTVGMTLLAESLSYEDPEIEGSWPGYSIELPPDAPEEQVTLNRQVIQRMTGQEFERGLESALRRNEIGGLPKMMAVIPGQYNPSGWGIDMIGISMDSADRITVWHFEAKFVEKDSKFIIKLGTPKAGTQTGEAWTRNAVRNLLESSWPEARRAKERLRRAMKKMPNFKGQTITIAHMEEFLMKRVPNAPTRVIVPNYADVSKVIKQISALVRHGRNVKLHPIKVPK